MMVRSVRGTDPHTGTTVEVAFDDTRIVSVTDLGLRPAAELPYVAPGFIDGQVNGYGGLDINGEDISAETVMEITGQLAKTGVTRPLSRLQRKRSSMRSGSFHRPGRRIPLLVRPFLASI